MIRITGYLIALFLLCGFALYLFMRVPHLPSANVPQKMVTSVRTENIHEETDAYVIDVNYPQTGITSVDAAVRSDIEQAIDAFRAYPQNPPDSAVQRNELTGEIGRIHIGDDAVSVELLISEYTGGAHPNTAIAAVNVDPRSGLTLTLDDALALIGKSLSEVAAESHAMLERKLGEAFFEQGAQPTRDNYATFILTSDAVTFVFQNYQVAPYAAGPQFVTFERAK